MARSRIALDGLPHSEISGSKPVCGSPELIAAYHVLHQRRPPRHPPYALCSLAILLDPSNVSVGKIRIQPVLLYTFLLQLRCLTFTFVLSLYFKGKYAL